MKLLVTGASGFLGKAVVHAAARAGHQVIALVRPTAGVDQLGWPTTVEILRGDLRQYGDWCARVADVEVVIHLAAAVAGDLAAQFAGTVAATETLLEHLPRSGLRRFVHISTFSVYDYGAVPIGGTLTELTPLEPKPETRDAYTVTKLLQEMLVVDVCRQRGIDHVVIRPGAVYGPGKDWDYGRAMKLGRFDLLFAPFARMKLVNVGNCADAIVRAVDAPVASGSIFNLVDDDPPSHARYHRLCRRLGADTGRAIYVPWLLVACAGVGIALINRIIFNDRARLPAFMAYRRQRASWKPMRYANRRAREVLGWTPRLSLDQALADTFAHIAEVADPARPNSPAAKARRP